MVTMEENGFGAYQKSLEQELGRGKLGFQMHFIMSGFYVDS